MFEIESILIDNCITFSNRNLSWGARLSSYEDLFDLDFKFVGIELISDCKPPKNYIIIDHHNEYSSNKSSIEQVADLLNIRLNRYQTLVALNDSGYIPAMLNYGATIEEVSAIRKKDRMCQGVTLEEEKLAEKSISENMEIISGVPFIKSFTNRFSPIADRIYFEYPQFVIYDDISWFYSGGKAHKLADNFKKEVNVGLAYYGGSAKFGFFGMNDKFKEYYKNKIIEVIKHG